MTMAKQRGSRRRGERGFTLIEMMIVVAIIAVLAGIAYPNYSSYMTNSRRSEAKTLLMQIAARQEQFFLDNRSYTATLSNLGYNTVNADGSVDSENKSYTASVTASTATTYTLTAVPQGGQASDPCGNLTLDGDGVRGRSGTGTKCW